jgi:hypothetical protein
MTFSPEQLFQVNNLKGQEFSNSSPREYGIDYGILQITSDEALGLLMDGVHFAVTPGQELRVFINPISEGIYSIEYKRSLKNPGEIPRMPLKNNQTIRLEHGGLLAVRQELPDIGKN